MKSNETAPAAKTPLTEEQSLVLDIIHSRIRGSKAYADAGNYQKRLQAKIGTGQEVSLPDGRRFALVDTFAGQDRAKKMTFIDRYELQEREG